MTSTTNQPTTVRKLDSSAAQGLAELAAIFDDLQTVLRCCERIVTELAEPSGESADLGLEAFWTTAVLSYARCFAGDHSGMGLTDDDVTGTRLQGEVLEWHKVLRQLRKHYADPAENPRERFAVGAAQDSHGHANGIAITSTPQPRVDDLTVRQTGALAYELSQLVDQRITEQQERVRTGANAMTKDDLDRLPLIDVAAPEESKTGGMDTDTDTDTDTMG